MGAVIVNLECVTNMHVGNGDVNFNIIDNEVERDVVTGYPTINASGVKGSLREYFVKAGVAEETVKDIFGGDGAGKLKFLCADLLALPMRASAGNAAYYLVSTKEALDNYAEKCGLFLNGKPELKFEKIQEKRHVEGKALSEVVSVLGKEVHLMGEEDFKRVALPVIARNKLESGISKNLWYEEVVPHKSIFTFAVLAEQGEQKLLEQFVETVNGKVLQFGGNATIGYGLCKVSVTEVI